MRSALFLPGAPRDLLQDPAEVLRIPCVKRNALLGAVHSSVAGPVPSCLPCLPSWPPCSVGHAWQALPGAVLGIPGTSSIEVGAGWLPGHPTLWVRGGWGVAKQGVDANQQVALLCYKLDISKRFAHAAAPFSSPREAWGIVFEVSF